MVSKMIEEIANPVDRFVAFVAERDAIRVRRFIEKKPWPWTNDQIMQDYRFTNVHREDDTVSEHYQKTIRNRWRDDPIVLPATIMYRWFNRPSTCDHLFRYFEEYLNKNDIVILFNALDEIPPPHVTGSFIITGKPGYPKGIGVLRYFHDWCQAPWLALYDIWTKHPPLLSEMYDQISGEGLGSFMRGQIVADLKYLPFMLDVEDWWTWATPGPGSMRGLNIICGRPMNEHWAKDEWLPLLIEFGNRIKPMLKSHGITIHNQDLQNCLCEFSKYEKTRTGVGRPRQTFKNRGIVNV